MYPLIAKALIGQKSLSCGSFVIPLPSPFFVEDTSRICGNLSITLDILIKANMKKKKDHGDGSRFTGDNADTIRKVIDIHKNVLICGVEGVGKITNTVQAVKGDTNVYYLGNPVDYEGKMRPGSYEKYLKYIHSLKHDIRIIEAIQGIFTIEKPIILIIDEVYGRSEAEYEQIGKLFFGTRLLRSETLSQRFSGRACRMRSRPCGSMAHSMSSA